MIRHVGKREEGKSPGRTDSLAELIPVIVAVIWTEYRQYGVGDALLKALQQEAKRVCTTGEMAAAPGVSQRPC